MTASHPPRLGLYMDMRAPSDGQPADWPSLYAQALELCDEADAAGHADEVWLSEHHGFGDGYLPQPLTLAAAIAARTSGLRIGTAVLNANVRSAAQIVESAAIVSHLAPGRLDLGLGAGYLEHEFALFGSPVTRPTTRLFEQIDEVEQLWENGRVTPMPDREARPVVWAGVNGPRGARLAGKRGLPLLSSRTALIDEYSRGLADGGFDPLQARMAGPVNIFLADDPELAVGRVAAHYGRRWASYAAAGAPGTPTDPRRALARGLDGGLRGLLVASPQQAADEIVRHFRSTPIRSLYAWSWFPDLDHELAARHVQLWCEVLPPVLARRWG